MLVWSSFILETYSSRVVAFPSVFVVSDVWNRRRGSRRLLFDWSSMIPILIALPYIPQNVSYLAGSSSDASFLIISMALRTIFFLITLMPSVACNTSRETFSGSESESTTPTKNLSQLGTISCRESEMKTLRTYSFKLALMLVKLS